MMWARTLFLLLVLCCVLVSFSGSVSAQSEYLITETELTRLEQIFSQLSVNNQELLTDLEQSKQDLTTARQKLVSYQQELNQLQVQLTALQLELQLVRTDLQTANSSLKKANESLTKYEREVKNEIHALKMQRTILGATIAYLIIKK